MSYIKLTKQNTYAKILPTLSASFLVFCIATIALPEKIYSQQILMNIDSVANSSSMFVPFPFYHPVLKFSAGVTFSENGSLQSQASTNILGAVSSNGSATYYLKANNFRIPSIDRLFISGEYYGGRIGEFIRYSGFNNPDNPQSRAGSNKSDQNNNITAQAYEFHFNTYFNFLLPIGDGKQQAVPKIILKDGFPISDPLGAKGWNPFRSGRTFIEFSPYYSVTIPEFGENIYTTGAGAALIYDNRDFSINPTKGSYQKLEYIWAPEVFDFTPYNLWSIEIGKYIPLSIGKNSRQSTLALNVLTKYSNTWDDVHEVQNGRTTYERPQNLRRGMTLGGLYRFRGYDVNRFSDQALLFYGVEYRHVPNWKFSDLNLFGRNLEIDWVQLIALGEVGRVAPEWDPELFHQHMKWNAGVGIRTFINKILVRVDFAYSTEGSQVQMNVSHPF